jgi:hypothetical protein
MKAIPVPGESAASSLRKGIKAAGRSAEPGDREAVGFE